MTEHNFVVWRGQPLKTIGDVMKVLDTIHTKELATEFMDVCRDHSPHAEQNIGYLTGYYDQKRAAELRELLNVSHPIFGRETVTAKEAFELGVKIGREKNGGRDVPENL